MVARAITLRGLLLTNCSNIPSTIMAGPSPLSCQVLVRSYLMTSLDHRECPGNTAPIIAARHSPPRCLICPSGKRLRLPCPPRIPLLCDLDVVYHPAPHPSPLFRLYVPRAKHGHSTPLGSFSQAPTGRHP